MAPLASSAEWPDYSGVAVPANAATLLEAASGLVRIYTGWDVAAASVAGQVLDSRGGHELLLPTLYLTAVTEVVVSGSAVTDYTWSAMGVLHRDAGWPVGYRTVTASYAHGYDPVPAEIKQVVVGIASRSQDGTEVKTAERIGDWSASYATSRGGLSPAERVVLDRYRISS